MAALLVIVGTAAASSMLGYLIWRGFYDGDAGDDIVVHADRIAGPGQSVMVDVRIANPGPAPALVALALRPTWRPAWAGSSVSRRTVFRPGRLTLSECTVGAVPAGEGARFRLTAPSRWRAIRLEVTVGGSRRLRRHCLHIGRADKRLAPIGSTGHAQTARLPVVIRFAYPDDAPALAGLAALDEDSVPDHPVLLAEVDGELWAALSVESEAHVADPYRPSGELVDLLRHRARQLHAPSGSITRGRRAAWMRR